MKSIKNLREEYNLIVESDSKSSKKMTVATVPTLVVLKRRAIRVFPGGRQVGLYYAQQIDKYVTIPFGDENDRENKRVVNVFEELKQIDELDDRTSMNAFAKLHHKASNAQSKDELVKYVKKTSNVGVMHLAKYARKKGWETAGDEAKKLLAYSKKYRKVADLVENNLNEVSSKPVLITPKPKPESSAPSAAPAPNNTSAAPAQAAAPSRKIRGLKYEQLPSKSIPGSAKKKKPKKPVFKGIKDKRGGKNPEATKDRLDSFTHTILNRKYGDLSKAQQKYLTPKRAFSNTISSGEGLGNALAVGLATHLIAKKHANNIKESTQVQLDGNTFEINTNIAEKLVSVYDTLNEQNKKKMIDMLMNEDTQSKIIEFVTRY